MRLEKGEQKQNGVQCEGLSSLEVGGQRSDRTHQHVAFCDSPDAPFQTFRVQQLRGPRIPPGDKGRLCWEACVCRSGVCGGLCPFLCTFVSPLPSLQPVGVSHSTRKAFADDRNGRHFLRPSEPGQGFFPHHSRQCCGGVRALVFRARLPGPNPGPGRCSL